MTEPIVYFDGVCGLCNRFVDFLMRKDRAAIHKVAPLQGQYAAKRIPKDLHGELTTIVLEQNGKFYTQSAAVIRILMTLGGLWRAAAIFLFVPACLRDRVYAWISQNRYRWFGKRETCRKPTPEEAKRFLP